MKITPAAQNWLQKNLGISLEDEAKSLVKNIGRLEMFFKNKDRGNNGMVSYDEFKEAFQILSLPIPEKLL